MLKKKPPKFSALFYWSIYGILVSLRFSFVYFQIPGYIHPDEFFQSVELANHDINPRACSLRTWEFQPTGPGPIRSRSSLYPLVHLPIKISGNIYFAKPASSLSGSEWLQRLLLPTRLVTALLSFLPDALVFYFSCKFENSRGKNAPMGLLMYSSMAYGGLLYNTRTLSNVWETAAVSAFCLLSFYPNLLNVALQGFIAAWAVFLRPTFPAFVLPFLVLELIAIWRSFSYLSRLFLCVSGLLTAACVGLILSYLDTIYFGSGKDNMTFSDLIVTPLRFLNYNSAVKTLREHGLHPWYHYVAVHWPLILTPPLAVFALFPPVRQKTNNGLLFATWFAVIIPTAAFSLIGHKETRFLLPALPFAVPLVIARWRNSRVLLPLLALWIAYQGVLVVFWGFLHQGGLLGLLKSIRADDANEASLNVFYATYMPPRFAFGEPLEPLLDVPKICRKLAPSTGFERCSRVVDFSGLPQENLFTFMDCLKTYSPANMVVRIVVPGSVLPLEKSLLEYGEVLHLDTFFPHLSTENLPRINLTTRGDVVQQILNQWDAIKVQLALHSFTIALT